MIAAEVPAEKDLRLRTNSARGEGGGRVMRSPDEWDCTTTPNVKPDSIGWPRHPRGSVSSWPESYKRAEFPNRKSVRPRERGFPGNGPVIDSALPLRPGHQATFETERSYKGWASQAQGEAKGAATAPRSLGKRLA